MPDNNRKYCPKCGTELNEDANYCSKCGYSFFNTPTENKKHFSVGWIIALLVVGASLFGVVKYEQDFQKEQKQIELYNSCVNAVNDMYSAAAYAEDTCNMIVNVWHDAIYKENDSDTIQYVTNDSGYFYSDFNDALAEYGESDEYTDNVNEIKQYDSEVLKSMKSIRGAEDTGKYSKLVEKVEELYDSYLKFVNLPIYINGSYKSFNEDFENYDNEFFELYRTIPSYFTRS